MTAILGRLHQSGNERVELKKHFLVTKARAVMSLCSGLAT